MVYKSYKSDYPNQVHQLLVSLSRHLWMKKNGELDYQKKPFDISKRYLEFNAESLFFRYVIRDHASKVLYCEYAPYTKPLDLIEFVHRAWMPKNIAEWPQVFCGMPEFLMVPANIWSETLGDALARLKVKALKPSSGFASGMRVFRELDDFERVMLFWYHREQSPTFKSLTQAIAEFLHEHNTIRPINRLKLVPWNMLKEHFERFPPRFPPPFEEFSGNSLPDLPPTKEIFDMPDPIQTWLTTEHLRKNGDEPTYQELLSELAEAEVWPVYEEWDDFTPYEKFKTEEEKRTLAAFKYRFRSAMLRALDYNPRCMMALAYYGIFLKDERESFEAARFLRKAVEVGREQFVPDDDYHPHYILKNRPYLRALWQLSDLLLNQGRSAEAEHYVRELHSLDRDDLYDSSNLLRRASMG